mmetsp:Transcript_11638/g.43755  ORF Transcript_11638/g.43755 Transcript_11638/m.43755 type:complete len:90 (-) Transcript_11638:715-984(-)
MCVTGGEGCELCWEFESGNLCRSPRICSVLKLRRAHVLGKYTKNPGVNQIFSDTRCMDFRFGWTEDERDHVCVQTQIYSAVSCMLSSSS